MKIPPQLYETAARLAASEALELRVIDPVVALADFENNTELALLAGCAVQQIAESGIQPTCMLCEAEMGSELSDRPAGIAILTTASAFRQEGAPLELVSACVCEKCIARTPKENLRLLVIDAFRDLYPDLMDHGPASSIAKMLERKQRDDQGS